MRENRDFVVPVNILTLFAHAPFSWAARHTTVCLDVFQVGFLFPYATCMYIYMHVHGLARANNGHSCMMSDLTLNFRFHIQICFCIALTNKRC